MSQVPQKESTRVAKFIASSGLYSRREAERLILANRVSVNDVLIEDLGRQITPSDTVKVDGTLVHPETDEKLWLFHKPKGYICSRRDENDRPTVYDILPEEYSKLHLVGRLDYNTEGLLLLTNSPSIKRYLELPSNNFIRVYKVRVFGNLSEATIQKLENGIYCEGLQYKPCKIIILEQNTSNTWLEISLQEGKYREIRNMMEYARCQVSRLIRTSYGEFTLGNLKPGALALVDQQHLYMDEGQSQ